MRTSHNQSGSATTNQSRRSDYTPTEFLLTEDELDHEEVHQQQLEEVSRTLIMREEQLFSQDSCSEEEEDQLLTDFEALRVQIWTAVQNTFSSTSSGHLEMLRSAWSPSSSRRIRTSSGKVV